MKKLLFIALGVSCICLVEAASVPATRTYVSTRLTEEAQYRRTGDALLLDRIAEVNATLQLVGSAVDNLASNLQASASSLTEDQLISLTEAVAGVSTNLSAQASRLHENIKLVVEEAVSVYLTTNWMDRCVRDLGELSPVASNEYQLASWPAPQHDRRVRQYMATFSLPTAGFIALPEGSKIDYDTHLPPGRALMMCTDLNEWLFIQLRHLED